MVLIKRGERASIIVIFLSLLLALYSMPVIAELDKSIPIKSASEYDYPPFSIVNNDGSADGFSVELLTTVLKQEGFNVDFYTGPWSEIKEDLAQGRIQVLPLVGRTPEREAIYDFSVPYLSLYGAVFVRSGDTRITSLKDLADKEIIVMKGDNAEEFARRNNISKYIITTETYEEAFKLLSEGKYDAIVCQRLVGVALIKKIGITNVVPAISRIDTFKQDFAFAVKKGDSDLLTILNEGLSKTISDGSFDEIYNKWIDLELYPQEGSNTLTQESILFSKEAIKQKAKDIAKQIEIYLLDHPDYTIDDLRNDIYFNEIAVQRVGKTGYTAVTDYDTLVNYFHSNPAIENLDLSLLAEQLPGFWDIMSKTRGGYDAEGIYDWKEPTMQGLYWHLKQEEG